MKYLIPVLCAVAMVAVHGADQSESEKLKAEIEALKAKLAELAPKVVVDGDQLEKRGGLYTFEGKPFTGVGVSKHPNGQKWWEVTYKDGKKHGLSTMWHENGQKRSEITLNDGKLHGLSTTWHENGQKWQETTFKDGRWISVKSWDEDGNPKASLF